MDSRKGRDGNQFESRWRRYYKVNALKQREGVRKLLFWDEQEKGINMGRAKDQLRTWGHTVEGGKVVLPRIRCR